MPRPLKRGMIDASTIILSKDMNKYAFMCGSNFYESDVIYFYQKIYQSAQYFSRFLYFSDKLHIGRISDNYFSTLFSNLIYLRTTLLAFQVIVTCLSVISIHNYIF